MKLKALAIISIIIVGSAAKYATGQMILEASDQGHISVGPYSVGHSAANQSYSLGPDPSSHSYGIPYFMFDIPFLTEPLDAIKFSVYNPGDVYFDSSSDLLRDQGIMSNGGSPFEIKLWDYTSDPALFISDSYQYFAPGDLSDTPWGSQIEDLRSGTMYGSRFVDSSLDGSWIDFYLTGDALADVMASQGGTFAMGAWQENFKTAFYGAEGFSLEGGFEGNNHPLAQLEIMYQRVGSAIPEPSTYGLLASLFLGLCIAVRKFGTQKKDTPRIQ
jgi:hypothetical protein